MKHIEETVQNGKIIHFSKNGSHSFCDSYLPPDKCKETTKKVTCGHCIGKIELALKVSRTEYI